MIYSLEEDFYMYVCVYECACVHVCYIHIFYIYTGCFIKFDVI